MERHHPPPEGGREEADSPAQAQDRAEDEHEGGETMRKLIWAAVLAGAIAAVARWLYKEFGPPCDDLAREQEQAAGEAPEPHLVQSLYEGRDR